MAKLKYAPRPHAGLDIVGGARVLRLDHSTSGHPCPELEARSVLQREQTWERRT